ncbi:MAG: ATP-binding cassette domain-containing protein, partial [Thermodesulfobacteriota bacterium]
MVTLLEVTNLSKEFDGLRALDRLSFHVETDEIMGVIGPNGAGKTT